MGDTREDWAKVEYDFIVSDEAFNDMSDDLQLAYLRWWITAVAVRRHVFAARGIANGALAYRCRVKAEVMQQVVKACCANGLAVRGNSGSVKLKGVLKLHGKLRGFSDAPWPGKSEGVSAGRIAAKSLSDGEERRGEGDERENPPTPPQAGGKPKPASRALTKDEIARGASTHTPLPDLPAETRSDLRKIATARADHGRGGPAEPIGVILKGDIG